MPLNLYRRHFRKAGKCVGGHAPDSRTYEPEELRRSHKGCICPIYADGTLNRRFRRKNTGKHAWEEAKAVAEHWEQNGCWDQQELQRPQPEPVSALPVVEAPNAVSIEQAIAAFVGEHAASSSPNTVKKYGMVLKKLSAYSASRGYFWIEQLRPIDLREFRQSWTVAVWPDDLEVDLPGCGQGFHPYGMADVWQVAGWVAEEALSVLKGRATPSEVISMIRAREFFKGVFPGITFNRKVPQSADAQLVIKRRPLREVTDGN